jgi:hypothetical protein
VVIGRVAWCHRRGNGVAEVARYKPRRIKRQLLHLGVCEGTFTTANCSFLSVQYITETLVSDREARDRRRPQLVSNSAPSHKAQSGHCLESPADVDWKSQAPPYSPVL